MINERIRQALQAEAADAPAAQDLWAHTTRRIRRHQIARWSSAAAGLLLAVAVGITAVLQLGAPQQVLLGDPAAPDGWSQVTVGEAMLAVPPDWQVHDLTDVTGEGRTPLVEVADGETLPEPEPVPCPPIDPERPVLLRSERNFPQGCPEDPAALTGLLVAPLDGPAAWFPAGVLEAGEPTRVGGHPARAVDAALLSTPAPVEADRLADDPATTYVLPALGLYIEARPGEDTDAVSAALNTVAPRTQADEQAVLQGVQTVDLRGDREAELVGWTIDADGRFHAWLREPVTRGWGARPWPAATGERFGAIVITDDRVRIVTARPGAEPAVWALPEEARSDWFDWSPAGDAVAWLVREPEPRLHVADWRDADRLVDGDEPQRVTVAVRGLPDRHGGGLIWRGDGHLMVVYPDSEAYVADLARGEDGHLPIADPVGFSHEQR